MKNTLYKRSAWKQLAVGNIMSIISYLCQKEVDMNLGIYKF